MVFLVHRHPNLDAEAFRRYWKDTHAPIAAKLPGLRRYVQKHSNAGPDGSPPMYDGVAELWFEDAGALEQAMASPQGHAAVADTEKFMDVDRTQGFSVEEVIVV